jgi:hypothetical protein
MKRWWAFLNSDSPLGKLGLDRIDFVRQRLSLLGEIPLRIFRKIETNTARSLKRTVRYEQADVADVSRRVEPALFYDAKLDLTATS